MYFHEQLYRTSALMAKFKDFPVSICGVGAIGANLTENLARCGFNKLKIIDRDRIEERNLSTQPYYKSDIGAYKSKILTNSLYRALGISIEGITKELTRDNCSQLLENSQLIIDSFDNSIARQIVKDYGQEVNIPCLHVGLDSDYGEIIWNDNYRVPSANNDDVCDYPLARNLVMITVAISTEVIINYLSSGKKENFTITLKDFGIKLFD